jgi:hypothetical protein
MALIFNSITQFEIQPERTKKRVKRDDLDTLTEVWVGPSALEDSFVPPLGTAHPDFSLMTVISTSIKRLPMYVSEVRIEYHGKLDGGGSIQYTSVPTISQHWAEGEVAMSNSGTTISRRYTGKCVQIDYLTNRRPSGNPSNIGLAKEFLGFTNVWDQITSFGASNTIIMAPIQKLSCTDVRVEDKADGWYKVTETYQSRMYPGESIQGDSKGSISTSNRSSLGGPPADWAAATAQSDKAYNAALQMAFSLDQPLSTDTTTGSVAADTTQQLGYDPGWFVPHTTPALERSPILSANAAANAYNGQTASDSIQTSPLPY